MLISTSLMLVPGRSVSCETHAETVLPSSWNLQSRRVIDLQSRHCHPAVARARREISCARQHLFFFTFALRNDVRSGIKPTASPQICCRTTLRNVSKFATHSVCTLRVNKNWTLFHLSINWANTVRFKYFFSLLLTEINCDQVYPKIYLPPHPKSASALPCKMNKNVLANVAGMIS